MTQNPDIRALSPANIPLPVADYSPGVRAGDWIFVSGQLATDYRTGVVPEIAAQNPYTHDRVVDETHHIFDVMAAIAAEGGSDLSDAVRVYQWFTDEATRLEHFDRDDYFPGFKVGSYARALSEHMSDPRPASTAMAVHQQLVRDARVQVDAILRADGTEGRGFSAPVEVPTPIVKYSPALRRGDYVFLAGEIPVDWSGDYQRPVRRGEPNALADEASVNPYYWYETAIEAQVEYTLWKQARIAEEAGASLSRAIKAEVYLAHPGDFEGMDRVWRRWFPENPPARSVIPYMGMAGKGVRVEIAFQLLADDSDLTIEPLVTEDAPAGLGHEPQAVRCGDLIHFSTQLPHDGEGRLAAGLSRTPGLPFTGSPAADQMRRLRSNIDAIARVGDASADDVVRMLAVYDDLAHYQVATDAWNAETDGVPPATTTIGLVGGPMLVPGAHVSLDVTAYAPHG